MPRSHSTQGITTFTMLHRRLQTDLRFRYQCGFRLDQDAPSVSTFSRVFADMVEKQIAEQMQEEAKSLTAQSERVDHYYMLPNGHSVAVSNQHRNILLEEIKEESGKILNSYYIDSEPRYRFAWHCAECRTIHSCT